MRLDHNLPDLGSSQTPYEGREIVSWDDPRSLYWLSRTPANKSFPKLARYFEPQCDKFMCGPASIAIVLNALKLHSQAEIPVDSEHEAFARRINPTLPSDYTASFQKFTQRNIFDSLADSVKSIDHVYGGPDLEGCVNHGLNLQEIASILDAHEVKTQTHFVSGEACATDHATEIMTALSSEDTYVIANFDRSQWGLKGGGHVSPLGAFDVITRKALVLDVNVLGRWLWVDIDLLLKSMTSKDGAFNRGYVVASPQRSSSRAPR